MNAVLAGYRAAGPIAFRAAAAIADSRAGDAKWQRTIRGRWGVLDRYARWASQSRDLALPLLWVHAPSVGEGLQAAPVLEIIRARRPDVQLAYTHFSSSAEGLAAGLREHGVADFADYLPWDTVHDSRSALAALAPTALVFAKLDVWPVLVGSAVERGVGLGLLSATLSAESTRGTWWAKQLLGSAYAALGAVGAIDSEDASRLKLLGVRDAVLAVTGDTRYDQVWARAASVRTTEPLLTLLADPGRRVIVAGSTWPSDERVLLEAWRSASAGTIGVRLILAPHEPTPAHLAAVERWAAARGVEVARLSEIEGSGLKNRDSGFARDYAWASLILVDRVGVLADLYALADVAFVGGGFHAAGLHSVLEPAAFAVPVVFGPRYLGSRDARRLVSSHAAVSVRDVEGCAASFARWLADPAERQAAGRRAQTMVREGLGAAERSAELMMTLLVNSE